MLTLTNYDAHLNHKHAIVANIIIISFYTTLLLCKDNKNIFSMESSYLNNTYYPVSQIIAYEIPCPFLVFILL